MIIRKAEPSDAEGIKKIYLEAFEESENAMIVDLTIKLLHEDLESETLNLVAIPENAETQPVGHIAFSQVQIKSNTEEIRAHILAPLAALPEVQNQGIGSLLVKTGLKELSHRETGFVLVYGDPAYYRRFGFDTELAKYFIPPFELKYPEGWQALKISDTQTISQPVEIECVSPLNQPELW